MRNYKKMEVWQSGMRITKLVYVVCRKLPDYEKFGLRTQLQRATVSITSNISEGSAYKSEKNFRKFLYQALGSSYEVESQLITAMDLEFFNELDVDPILGEITKVQKMLFTLIKILNKSIND